MKKFKNIFLLSAVLTGIIFIWLIPKTNGEKKTRYVRVYTQEKDQAEDIVADKKDSIIENSSTYKTEKKKKKRDREIIQTDTLNGKLEMKHIKMSLFSRSRHFEPLVESPPLDSGISVSDTTTIERKL